MAEKEKHKAKKEVLKKAKNPTQRLILDRFFEWNYSGKECYESIRTLAKELNVSSDTIRRNINQLVANDVIVRRKEKVNVKNGQNNNHYSIKGVLKLSTPSTKGVLNLHTKGVLKISTNNINNNINNIYIAKYTFEEFQKLCIDGGIEKTSKDFEYAYNYLSANGFKTSNGNEIVDIVAYMKNWKWDDKNKQKKSSTDKYNQFQQNSYDFEELEKDLIAN